MKIKKILFGTLITFGSCLYAFSNTSNNIKPIQKASFKLCGNSIVLMSNYNKNKYSDWFRTNIIQMFNTKLVEFSKNKNHREFVEKCFFYVKTNNGLNLNNKKIVKAKKTISTKWFVNIPDYLYSKDVKFVYGEIVLLGGKKIKINNLEDFKKIINQYKNKIIFLRAIYKSKQKHIVATFTEVFDKNSILRFKTIIEIKSSNFNPIKNSPYDISIPKEYIDRTKHILGIDKMKFDHAEPAYNVNIRGYTY